MKRILLMLTASLVATALVLTGCGDDDDDDQTASESPSEPASEEATVETIAEGEQLSANDATEEELQTIPGVGPAIAEEIVEYRPYDAGTGPAKFREEMSKYLPEEDIEKIIVYLNFEE